MEVWLQHILNGLSLGALYALVALGYTMVYGVLQLINFAHAEIFMLGAFAGMYADRWLPPLPEAPRLAVIVLIAMAVCACVGLLMERIAYRPLRHSARINALITAIAVSLLIQSVGQLPWFMGPAPHYFPALVPAHTVAVLGSVQITLLQLLTFGTTAGLMVTLHLLVFHTRTGIAMRAVAQDSHTARLMGIDVERIIALTFVIGSALAAAAGILVGLNYPRIETTMGVMLGLKAFVAAVLGGIGNLTGAVIGGLLIGLVEALVVGYGSSSYRDAVAFLILIGILILRPAGLLGRHGVEKV